jgi:hypothetical protein
VANGKDAAGTQLGDGLAYLNATMMVSCLTAPLPHPPGTPAPDPSTRHYVFVMNLWNTTVSNDGGSTWQSVGSEGEALGDDISFIQSMRGEIVRCALAVVRREGACSRMLHVSGPTLLVSLKRATHDPAVIAPSTTSDKPLKCERRWEVRRSCRLELRLPSYPPPPLPLTHRRCRCLTRRTTRP